jgi:alkylation response protein AidB-like acyl-CoA dehydrogenase
MKFHVDGELADLRSGAREAMAGLWTVRSLLEAEHRDSAYRSLSRLGWLDSIGDGHHAGPQDCIRACIVAEELGRAMAPVGFAELYAARSLGLASDASGPLADGLQAGDAVVAALAERGGWHPEHWEGRLNDVDGTGTKISCSGALRPDLVVLACVGAGGPDVMLASVEGLEPNAGLDLVRPNFSIRLREVCVLKRLRIEQPAAAIGRVLAAAEAVGAARKLLAYAVEYAGERQQFGVQIGSFQAVKHPLAEMHARLEVGQSLVYRAALGQTESGPRRELSASMAKAYVSEITTRLAQVALQTFGGIGFTWDHSVHLYYRRILHLREAFGTPAYHTTRIARLAFDQGVRL